LATVELREGSVRKSKKLFLKSLESPNDNSMAQLEWASNRANLFDIKPSDYDIKNNYEALAADSFHNQSWEECIKYSEKWFIDMPFTKRPAQLGAHVASYFLDDIQTAIDFTRAGLVSNPNDPLLLNNMAYYLAKEGSIDEAEKYLIKGAAIPDIESSLKICMIATEGVISFRSGEVEKGRKKYLEAIELSEKANKKYYHLWPF